MCEEFEVQLMKQKILKSKV